jgi:hypothetical protein
VRAKRRWLSGADSSSDTLRSTVSCRAVAVADTHTHTHAHADTHTHTNTHTHTHTHTDTLRLKKQTIDLSVRAKRKWLSGADSSSDTLRSTVSCRAVAVADTDVLLSGRVSRTYCAV